MSLTQRVFTDAFRDMQRAMAALEQPLYKSARRSMLASPASLHNNNVDNNLFRYPATDMVETPEAYELNAELPGYDKNNIKIELADSRTLVLSGSVDEEKEIKPPTDAATLTENSSAKAGNKQVANNKDSSSQIAKSSENTTSPQWWVKERVSGSFSRSFAFPTPISNENIKASFDNGVLKVVIPKTSQDQAKKIHIQ